MAVKTYEVILPPWLGGSTLELDAQITQMVGLGLLTFVLFFLSDPFRIIEKVDLRLVRLYKAPEKSAVDGQKVVCIINPISGTKNSKWQYGQVVHPMLRCGGASVEAIISERPGHLEIIGEEMAKKFIDGDEEAFPDGGVLIMGGDGTFLEFVNGVLRGSSKGSMDIEDENVRKALQALRVAHIPVGSSNGIAKSNGCLTAYEALEQLIKGDGNGDNMGKLDLSVVDVEVLNEDRKTTLKKRTFDVMCTSLGFVSDWNELVEYKWRHLGKTLRETLASISLILSKRIYKGRLLIRPGSISAEELAELAAEHGYRDTASLPDANDHPGWKEITGPFLAVSWTTLPWIATDACIAPGAGFGEGQASVLVLKDVSRWQMLQAAVALEKGNISKLPFAYLYRASEMKLIPEEPGLIDTSGSITKNVTSLNVKLVPRALHYLRNPLLPKQ
mmetsp:Transcript_21666/g.42553  ORF Transcript_21666/g.42553 Transcript_21666/m.42553 type:complete len:445 (-) Transcript_21666:85-1419(-)|eukprot:CAMPEP_0171573998 /NCGR_PEP_ID=MMETSP0961-20121227/5092_1 /TAXON_ID=87120 /ORGANISM="Aurantiochytrium limacinum, Strain ATCCMYA-1381" /LENGTH=444 /DNA_ID=CAMNT_0012129223 /DNA_START=249 /DNA_END=1583 /DNA_ORIENTATION=+